MCACVYVTFCVRMRLCVYVRFYSSKKKCLLIQMRISRRKIIVSRWIKKHFKEETLYYHMLLIPLSCDICLTPYVVANLDHNFSISHALALSSAILNKFISQYWNESFLKVDISSFIFIFYRLFYLYYLRSYHYLKFGDFFLKFLKCTAFLGICIYIYIYNLL